MDKFFLELGVQYFLFVRDMNVARFGSILSKFYRNKNMERLIEDNLICKLNKGKRLLEK